MFNRRMLTPFDDLRAAEKFSNSKGKAFSLTVRNARGNDPAQLCIFDEVGDNFEGTGITAKDVAGFLASNRGKPVDVLVNSPGGFVFEGLTIYNGLISHDGYVTVTVVGIAASIASIITMAGDKRRAYENSNMMIHRAIGVCVGNTGDMADCGIWLDKMDDQLSGIYSARSGQSKAKMLGLMMGKVDGTLFNATEALKLGLIDEIIPNNGKGARNINPHRPGGVLERLKDVSADSAVYEARQRAAQRQRELAGV